MFFGVFFFYFFFNVTATTKIYTLSLHDALPISLFPERSLGDERLRQAGQLAQLGGTERSEEHTSELQSLTNLVCRLLLEKKNAKVAWSSAPWSTVTPSFSQTQILSYVWCTELAK